MKQKSRPLTNIVIPALDRSVLKRQLNLSPGLAKIAPYLPCHRDSFAAKVSGLVAGWLHQVMLTCPYPLAVMVNGLTPCTLDVFTTLTITQKAFSSDIYKYSLKAFIMKNQKIIFYVFK
jgi:hypothetical protein